jgi:hypothetical protein
MLGFCSFFKVESFPDFNKIIERELTIIGIQQIEEIFSTERKIFCTWIYTVLKLEGKNASTERRTKADYCTSSPKFRGLLTQKFQLPG